MRWTAPLALAALACLAAPAQAGAVGGLDPGYACIPENTFCHPRQVLCPRLGGTAGWCVMPSADREGASMEAGAGNHQGPAGGARGELRWADADGNGLRGVQGAAEWEGQACLDFAMVLDLALPDLPIGGPGCSWSEDLTASLEP